MSLFLLLLDLSSEESFQPIIWQVLTTKREQLIDRTCRKKYKIKQHNEGNPTTCSKNQDKTEDRRSPVQSPFDIRPGNGSGLCFQSRSPYRTRVPERAVHGANRLVKHRFNTRQIKISKGDEQVVYAKSSSQFGYIPSCSDTVGQEGHPACIKLGVDMLVVTI